MKIIKEQILKERRVYKTAEFEEIDSAIYKIRTSISGLFPKKVFDEIIRHLDFIEQAVEEFGLEEV